MLFDYWFMFFISIVIATIAMTLGVGGALFFSPVFIILFPLLNVPVLTPATAFAAALITEVFGFSSGFIGYSKKKLIDYKTALGLLIVTIPLAILGTVVKRLIEENFNQEYLNLIFGVFLFLLAYYIYSTNATEELSPSTIEKGSLRTIIDAEGITHQYKVCNQPKGKALTGSGGFITGLISVGIGETTVSTLRMRCNLPMKVAAATSVFVVTLTVMVSALFDILYVVGINHVDIVQAIPWNLIVMTIPGVIIGGQIGPKISSGLSSEKSEKILIAIFVIFGFIMLLKAVLSLIGF